MSEDKKTDERGSVGEAGKAGSSPIEFQTFVLSLSSSAMYHLGLIPNPDTNRPEKNLPLARQTIDILAMLRDKTQGNLNQDEQRMLDHLLYDLRVRFVEASKQTSK